MTNHDSAEFAELFTVLAQAFDKQASDLLVQIYFDSLKDFPIEEVARGIESAIRIKKFWPKVGEIRELIEGSVDDRAAQAWAAFMEAAADGGQASVKFEDRAAASAMDAVFGGWVQACRALSAGGTDERGRQVGGCSDEMLASYQKHFARQYVAALNTQREVELYRPGLSEMSMREGGGAWAARMPTLKQPVIYIGAGKAISLRLSFDVAQGRLTAESLALLESGWEGVKAIAAGESRRLKAAEQKALPPAPGEELASAQEVEQIKQAVKKFSRGNVINITDAKAAD